jgi:transglutaminase-like putative cysteine protease
VNHRPLFIVLCILSLGPCVVSAAHGREMNGLSADVLRYNDVADADTSLTNRKHAVILLDDQQYHLRPDGSMSIVVHKAVRIQTPYARERYRIVLFQYNALTDQPRMEFAGVRTPDGKWQSTGTVGLRDTLIQAVGPFVFYHNLRQYTYILPTPVPGSILEYQYVVERQSQLVRGQFEQRLLFNDDDPIVHLQRTVSVPESLSVQLFPANGPHPAQVTTAHGERTYSWTEEKVRPAVREYGSPPLSDPTNSVVLTTFRSWRELSSLLEKTYDERSRPTPALRALVAQTVGKRTGDAALRAIYELVATSVPYVPVFDFQVIGVIPDDAETIWQNRAADGKDHACLLGACLRAAGFPVTFALANLVTDPDTTAPSITTWNHTLVRTSTRAGRAVWLDSATETAPFGVLPGSAQGKVTLLLTQSGPLFQRAPQSRASENTETVTLDLAIDAQGNMNGTMKTVPTGVSEMQERGMLKKIGRIGRREFFTKRLSFIAPNGTITKYDIAPPGDLATPFSTSLTVEIKRWGQVVGDTIIGSLPPGFTAWPITGLNQWVYETSRVTPLDISLLAPSFRIVKKYTVRIPEGYRIGVVHPAPITNRVGSFSASWTLLRNVVHLTEILTVEKGKIMPDEYPDLRTLWFAAGQFETTPIRLIKAKTVEQSTGG